MTTSAKKMIEGVAKSKPLKEGGYARTAEGELTQLYDIWEEFEEPDRPFVSRRAERDWDKFVKAMNRAMDLFPDLDELWVEDEE